MLHWISNGADVVIASERGENRDFGVGTVWEVSRSHQLVFQHDGNLALHFDGRVIWATGTGKREAEVFSVQSDGNTVLYAPNGRATWATDTWRPGLQFVIQSDGNLVLRDRDGELHWQSSTGGGRVGDLCAASTWAARRA